MNVIERNAGGAQQNTRNYDTFYELSTFYRLCEVWLKKKKIKLKNSSYEKYSYLLSHYILPELGSVRIEELNLPIIEKGITNIYDSNKSNAVSSSTMKSVLYLINAILSYGAYLGYFTSIQVIFEMPNCDTQKITVLNTYQESELISYLHNHRDNNSLGIMLSLFTGMRLGEVCSLQRKDIDMDKSIIYIKSTVQRLRSAHNKEHNKTELVVTAPKSRTSYREIPIPDFLHQYLHEHNIMKMKPDYYVLSKNSVPYEPRTLQYGFKKVLELCHIKHMKYHCLRHTFASKCIKLGFDVKSLSEILGHASVNFTLNRYVHSDIEHKRNQMNLFNSDYRHLIK